MGRNAKNHVKYGGSMPSKVSEHFDDYPIQTQAKHQILEGYLPAYLTALSKIVDGFHYIDGFAGQGSYNGQPGSPVRAIELLESNLWLHKSQLSFVEEKPKNFAELQKNLLPLIEGKNMAGSVIIEKGSFAQHVHTLLNLPIYDKRKIATFAFIDPCGVTGVRMEDIAAVLEKPFGEVLLFFNYDGMQRVLGSIQKGTMLPDIATEYFGDRYTVAELIDKMTNLGSHDKEELITETLMGSLKNIAGARFVIPFRFGHKRVQHGTSHYLIHISTHKLPFKIMKDVMRKAGQREDSLFGSLFMEKDHIQPLLFENKPDVDQEKNILMNMLQDGPQRVVELCSRVFSPDSMLAEFEYKTILKEFEATNKIKVFDKYNSQPYSASIRRKGSLADDCWIHKI